MNIALILSGGTGSRMGADIPKQYMNINGKMLITYCLEMFLNHKEIDAVWIVAAPDWKDDILADLQSHSISTKLLKGFSLPGRNRALSIVNGLTDIRDSIDSDEDPIIIIHDAARPNLSPDALSSYIAAMDGFDGVMPTLPMKDTVYLSEDGSTVSELLDRGKIFAGQAPELYRLRKYLSANEALLPDKILSINGTTEPAIMAGLNVAMVPGDENNYKITTQADLRKFCDSLK